MLLCIGSFSFFLKGAYIHILLADNTYKTVSLTPDSYGYIHLAQNMVNHHRYAQNDITSKYLSLLRPPGYPLFYAFFDAFGAAPVGVLWSHAIIGAGLSVLVTLLAFLIMRSLLAALVAGVLSSVSPAGFFVAGEMVADLLFAFIFLAGFCLFYYGVVYAKSFCVPWAGLLFGLSALIKPITVLWPLFSIFVYYFLSRANKIRVSYCVLGVFVMLQLFIIFGWSLRNYFTAGVFTLSTVGTQTLRHYLAVEVEQLAKGRNSPATIVDAIKKEQQRLRRQAWGALHAGTSIKKLHASQRDESLHILSSHLYLTYLCYKRNIAEHISGKRYWPLYAQKLAKSSFVRNIFGLLVCFHNYVLKTAYVVIVVGFFMGLVGLKKLREDGFFQKQFFSFLALILTGLYFIVFSGLTFWTGPRIIYPVEFAIFIASIIFGCSLLYLCARLFRARDFL